MSLDFEEESCYHEESVPTLSTHSVQLSELHNGFISGSASFRDDSTAVQLIRDEMKRDKEESTATGPQASSRLRDFCRVTRIYASIIKQLIALPFQRKIELREPEQVLREKLGDDLEVLDFTTERLVKWGDNYGSTIVKACVNVRRRGDCQVEQLHLVAKMLPPTDFQRESFQCEVTIAKEIFLYEQIIPAYRKLYESCGSDDFDIVPKFYGGRLALKPDVNGVDEGAVILLENLKESGYVMEDRLKGLTLAHLKIAIPAIAKFHAIGLAMKRKNPEFFKKMSAHAKPLELPHDVLKIFVLKTIKIVKNTRQLSSYYERFKSLNRIDGNESTFLEYLEPDEPWASLVHRDLWINNVMFRLGETAQDGFKLFDFQSYSLASPMTDLLYFLFSSLPREFEDFDRAVSLYRECAHRTLIQLDCADAARLFEKSSFEQRLKLDAKSELYHCVLMSRNIETRSGWDMVKISETSTRRIKRIFEIYEDRGWF